MWYLFLTIPKNCCLFKLHNTQFKLYTSIKLHSSPTHHLMAVEHHFKSGLFKLRYRLFHLCLQRRIKSLHRIWFYSDDQWPLPWRRYLRSVSPEATEGNPSTKVSATCKTHDVSRGRRDAASIAIRERLFIVRRVAWVADAWKKWAHFHFLRITFSGLFLPQHKGMWPPKSVHMKWHDPSSITVTV